MEGFALASTKRDERCSPKLEMLLEAARRASWDALRGPVHLRAGRFHPTSREQARPAAEGATQQGAAVDGASRRR